MFSFLKSPFYNKKLSDYCKQSTMESIKRLTESYKKKKDNQLFLDKNNYKLISYNSPIPPPKPINIFIFFSISTMLFFFFRYTKIHKIYKIKNI